MYVTKRKGARIFFCTQAQKLVFVFPDEEKAKRVHEQILYENPERDYALSLLYSTGQLEVEDILSMV